MSCNSPALKLRNGLEIPIIGLGTSLRGKNLESTQVFVDSVKHALKIGYRHIDTAKCYNNEHLIAKAIKVNILSFNSLCFLCRHRVFV